MFGDVKVSVVGGYRYPEALERLFFRGFQGLGCQVSPEPMSDADVTFCVKVGRVPEGSGGVSVLLWPDNVERFPEVEGVVDGFDEVFCCHGDVEGADQLNFGYDAEIHRSVFSDKRLGAVFVGTPHGCREWMVGVEGLRLFGNGWGELGVETGAVYGGLKREVYGSAVVSVNQTLPRDYVNMRFYEALRMGRSTAFVTDRWPEGEGWVPGKHFLRYDGSREGLEAVLDEWEGREGELLGIAEEGYEAVAPFTYERRAREVLEKVL